MLVDHLRDGVAKKNDVLVEGFDLPLKLDPVDEIDRHGDALLAEGIEEGILKKLTLVSSHFYVLRRRIPDETFRRHFVVVFLFSGAWGGGARGTGGAWGGPPENAGRPTTSTS